GAAFPAHLLSRAQQDLRYGGRRAPARVRGRGGTRPGTGALPRLHRKAALGRENRRPAHPPAEGHGGGGRAAPPASMERESAEGTPMIRKLKSGEYRLY